MAMFKGPPPQAPWKQQQYGPSGGFVDLPPPPQSNAWGVQQQQQLRQPQQLQQPPPPMQQQPQQQNMMLSPPMSEAPSSKFASFPAPPGPPGMSPPQGVPPSAPASQPQGLVNTLPYAEYRNRLIQIYSSHNPTNVEKVDYLLGKYQGQEEVLYQAVCHKYNIDPVHFHGPGQQQPQQQLPPVQTPPQQAPQTTLPPWAAASTAPPTFAAPTPPAPPPPAPPAPGKSQAHPWSRGNASRQGFVAAPKLPSSYHQAPLSTPASPATASSSPGGFGHHPPPAAAAPAPKRRKLPNEVMEWDPATGEMVSTQVDLDQEDLEELLGTKSSPPPPQISMASTRTSPPPGAPGFPVKAAPSWSTPRPPTPPPPAPPPRPGPATQTIPLMVPPPPKPQRPAPKAQSYQNPWNLSQNKGAVASTPLHALQAVGSSVQIVQSVQEEPEDEDDAPQGPLDLVEVDFFLLGENSGFFEATQKISLAELWKSGNGDSSANLPKGKPVGGRAESIQRRLAARGVLESAETKARETSKECAGPGRPTTGDAGVIEVDADTATPAPAAAAASTAAPAAVSSAAVPAPAAVSSAAAVPALAVATTPAAATVAAAAIVPAPVGSVAVAAAAPAVQEASEVSDANQASAEMEENHNETACSDPYLAAAAEPEQEELRDTQLPDLGAEDADADIDVDVAAGLAALVDMAAEMEVDVEKDLTEIDIDTSSQYQ
eukprot:TRINITY_DN40187_c0_g1_i1.p1 TRINITY_DN40187_c0_g1~~TRINITY_DN40187_c0_g1_i1.p1  ORF type:complete len:713 (+),score=223.55 TRINITY_DN40187_c0_g1_i1:121-2259(+)